MVPPVRQHRRSTGRQALCVLVTGFTLAAFTALHGQEQMQFFVLATDGDGNFVTDLTTSDVAMTENGQPAKTVKVEHFKVPVKLTITVDNGSGSTNVLGQIRDGLTGFLEALPDDVEVTIVTTAPQTRMHLRPTTDRQQILQSAGRIATDSENARFSEALVEYSERLAKDTSPHIPVLLMVTTTGQEASAVQPAQIEQALKVLASRAAPVYVFKTVSQQNNTTALERLDNGRQKIIGETAAKATGGRYEGIRTWTRIQEALPELGKQIATMHRAHTSQMLVTVARPEGATGQLQNPDIRLTRAGLQGSVSGNGRIPAAMPPSGVSTQ